MRTSPEIASADKYTNCLGQSLLSQNRAGEAGAALHHDTDCETSLTIPLASTGHTRRRLALSLKNGLGMCGNRKQRATSTELEGEHDPSYRFWTSCSGVIPKAPDAAAITVKNTSS